jgi:MauM/NapG family ferredoxin protein
LGISFGFGSLAVKTWQKNENGLDLGTVQRRQGRYVPANKKNASPRLSRRRFIDGVAAGIAGAAIVPLIGLSSHTGVIRPPGALPEEEFLRTCILCQECVRVCPTGGLKPTFLESGLAGIGTPQLVSRQGACSIKPSCPDLCGKVCPTGALRPIRPEQLKIGLARVDHNLCLAWDQGTKCLVCVEACLNNAAQAYQGRVTIDPQKCTGCGRCESGCPVAGSAIHVYPLEAVS